MHKYAKYAKYACIFWCIFCIYVDVSASILNGGFLSDFFLTERGVRQGDPLSLLLYDFVAEVLALLVREDDGIEGITLPGTPKPLKIQQYADDSILFTKSSKSVENFFQKVDIFQKASGSVINALKTRGLALGGFDSTTDTRLTDVTWTKNTEKRAAKHLGLVQDMVFGKHPPIPKWVVQSLHNTILKSLAKATLQPNQKKHAFSPHQTRRSRVTFTKRAMPCNSPQNSFPTERAEHGRHTRLLLPYQILGNQLPSEIH